jgi:hypothetical protein
MERNEAIYNDRKFGKCGGMLYKQLGEKYKISASRARDIFLKMERMKNYKKEVAEEVTKESISSETKLITILEYSFKSQLISVRTYNCLRGLISHYPEITVWQLANYKDTELLKLQNFGKVCLNEMKTALRDIMGEDYVPETTNLVKTNKINLLQMSFDLKDKPLLSDLCKKMSKIEYSIAFAREEIAKEFTEKRVERSISHIERMQQELIKSLTECLFTDESKKKSLSEEML